MSEELLAISGQPTHSIVPSSPPTSRCRTLAEIVLIFGVFCIVGAWPAPDVNEPYYLGKAIHFWNPDWLHGDFFMESADTHQVFYFTFGWLSLWLSPVQLVWTGRIATWLLLAWAWQRLSMAVVPRPWYSVLTAALFACLMERCHMAGEWVIGGVEAKAFAYVFVFLGLEAVVRNRWNRGLLMLGAASAFHAVVSGWAAVATGIAWLWCRRRAKPGQSLPPLRSLWPGILGGLLLALPGVLPSLVLDWGVDAPTARQAHVLYVFERLPHHLVLTGMRPEFILRLALLWGFWQLIGWWERRSPLPEDRRESLSRLRAFVTGAVAITFAGAALHLLIPVDRVLAAGVLRYYWFRLTDVAVPLGVALESAALMAWAWPKRPVLGRSWLALAILIAAVHLGCCAVDRMVPPPPRSHKTDDFEAWLAACDWVVNSGEIPPGARFLTPRLAGTFKWYTGHPDVADWKDVPQDAKDIVKWWGRLEDVYATGEPPPEPQWYNSLAEEGVERLKRLGAAYDADYVITQQSDPLLELDVVYANRAYIIYRLR